MHSDHTAKYINFSCRLGEGEQEIILAYHEELDRTYRQCSDSILSICPLCRYDEIFAIDQHNCRFEKRTERKESLTEI